MVIIRKLRHFTQNYEKIGIDSHQCTLIRENKSKIPLKNLRLIEYETFS